jgi:3-hydroxybutyryl-CoA dehydratase
MRIGEKQTWERTFTEDDVEVFGAISGDRGAHHILPDDQGRIMVQDLLTATLPTKIGGDWNYIAREMIFEFVRPVYVGDTVRCEATVTHVEEDEGRINLSVDLICLNQKDKQVLRGVTSGIIRIPTFDMIGRH